MEWDVKQVVWDVGSDKASGPDGYYFGFLKKFWDVIGADFTAAVKHFESVSTIKYGGSESFIALIPETQDPLRLNDYRRLHLMDCVSKIISKVLAGWIVSSDGLCQQDPLGLNDDWLGD